MTQKIPKLTRYITKQGSYKRETVREFDTYHEAFEALKDYRSKNDAIYYISSRSCAGWEAKK